MADAAWVPSRATVRPVDSQTARHTALVRLTHWITTICFLALLISGAEIVISHPRFYWGETGNVNTRPWFQLPIPSSRKLVNTGYGYVLPDQNGWSRALHFQTAWLLVFTGLVYGGWGLVSQHFRKNLLPADSPGKLASAVRKYLKPARRDPTEAWSYNALQKLTYLAVIFVLFPLAIWTGLAMSPAFVSAFPAAVDSLGGHQSARTLHFFVSVALLLFLVIHVAMVWLAGFTTRVGAMITGRVRNQEHS